jgi:hypothetical protein
MIEFTRRDILRGTVVEPAWYRCKIDSVNKKLSSKGDSTNYNFEASIIKNADNGDTKFQEVPVNWNFNSKAISFMVDFFKAFGVEVTAGSRFDENQTVGKELDIYIENGEYEGRIVNRVNHKYRQLTETTAA